MNEQSPRPGLVCLASFSKLAHANERALVIAAMGLPCWVFREVSGFELWIKEIHFEPIREEIERYEQECREFPFRRFRSLGGGGIRASRNPVFPQWIVFWVMAFFFLAQKTNSELFTNAGILDPRAIFEHGDWWRAITALTLHSDLAHLGANLATGILFGYFLSQMFGAGFAWSSILISGAIGNLLNAAFYRDQVHRSIGSSTAVFGALGILVGSQIAARLADSRELRFWEIIVPIGAGVALLAYLGGGDEYRMVDFMAHFWGFVAGIPIGAFGEYYQIRRRLRRWGQRLLGALAVSLLCIAWALALGNKG